MVLGTPGAELVALVEPVPSKLNGFDSLQVVPAFFSIEEFFASGLKADVINICTPNGLHAPLAIKALKNHFNVVIEKPMALSKKDCEEVIFTLLSDVPAGFCS